MAYDVNDTISGPTIGGALTKLKKALTPTPVKGMRLGVSASDQTGSEVKGTDNNQVTNSVTEGGASIQQGNPNVFKGESVQGIDMNAINEGFKKPGAVSMPDKGLGSTAGGTNNYVGLGQNNYIGGDGNAPAVANRLAAAGGDVNRIGDALPTYDSKTYNDTVSKQLAHEQGMARLKAGLPYDATEAAAIQNRGPTFSKDLTPWEQEHSTGTAQWFGSNRDNDIERALRKGNYDQAKGLMELNKQLGAPEQGDALKAQQLALQARGQDAQLALGREKNQVDRETNQLNAQKLGSQLEFQKGKEAFDQQMAKDRMKLDQDKYGTEKAQKSAELDSKLGQAFAEADSKMADKGALRTTAIQSYSSVLGQQEGTKRAAMLDPQARPILQMMAQFQQNGVPANDPRIVNLQQQLIKIDPAYNDMFGG